jgi:hypothetical protein
MFEKPWRGRLLALLACLTCDLVAPLVLVRNDGGFLAFVMLMANLACLLGAPLLLLLFLGGPLRRVVAAAVAQLVLGAVTFLGGAPSLHVLYLAVLGRPIEATVVDGVRECGEQAHGQDAATSYVCTTYLELAGPDGEEVRGGPMPARDSAEARAAAGREDGDPAGPITVREDRLGLLRPLPADPRTGWPVAGTGRQIHAGALVICWIAFLGTLAAAVVGGRRQRSRAESSGEDGVPPGP